MKKVCYVFMISLTIINFWGCAKKSTEPVGGGGQKPKSIFLTLTMTMKSLKIKLTIYG